MFPPDSIELADLAAQWRSAYVHIPFCRRRCPYCDFAVVASGDPGVASTSELTERYLAALAKEIDMEPEWGPLDAINLGGGTPSAVGVAGVAFVLRRLGERFEISPGAEISIEANPEDVSREFVAGLAEAGVTRVSLGVQSLDSDVLSYLGRAHTADQALAAIEACDGMVAVGVDLIFGAPGESVASWRSTVERTLGAFPHHLSAYALTVEAGTDLWRQVRSGATAPDADDQADKYELLVELAPTANLVRYEVSNFARPEHTCRYNLATWGQGEYIAFGLGAHGHRDGVRRRNVRAIGAYLDRVEAGQRPEAGAAPVDDPEMERLILGLRRACGVDLGHYEPAAAQSAPLQRLADAGVVAFERGRLRVLNPLLTDDVAATVLSLSP